MASKDRLDWLLQRQPSQCHSLPAIEPREESLLNQRSQSTLRNTTFNYPYRFNVFTQTNPLRLPQLVERSTMTMPMKDKRTVHDTAVQVTLATHDISVQVTPARHDNSVQVTPTCQDTSVQVDPVRYTTSTMTVLPSIRNRYTMTSPERRSPAVAAEDAPKPLRVAAKHIKEMTGLRWEILPGYNTGKSVLCYPVY